MRLWNVECPKVTHFSDGKIKTYAELVFGKTRAEMISEYTDDELKERGLTAKEAYEQDINDILFPHKKKKGQ